MKRFLAFTTFASRIFSRSARHNAASLFSGRAALTALCFLVIATAGMRQMDAAYRQSIVKEGRYSLVETSARSWHAQDLRVGWTKNGAFIGFRDYAVLRTLAVSGFALSILAFMTPAAWFALQALKGGAEGREEEATVRTQGMVPAE